jgi:hypothetical protein
LIIQEANAISTAYDSLDLFEADVAGNLQIKLKDYLDARLALYREGRDLFVIARCGSVVVAATEKDPQVQG